MYHYCNHCQNSQGCYCYWDLVRRCFRFKRPGAVLYKKKLYVRDIMIDSLIEQQHLCNRSRKACYFTAAMLVPLERAGTNMASLYKLVKFW